MYGDSVSSETKVLSHRAQCFRGEMLFAKGLAPLVARCPHPQLRSCGYLASFHPLPHRCIVSVPNLNAQLHGVGPHFLKTGPSF